MMKYCLCLTESVVVQVAAVVPDPQPSNLVYSILEGTADADMFTINPSNGEVMLAANLDYETYIHIKMVY